MDGMDWIILLLGCAGLILGMASLLRRRPAENFSVELPGWERTAAGGDARRWHCACGCKITPPLR